MKNLHYYLLVFFIAIASTNCGTSQIRLGFTSGINLNNVSVDAPDDLASIQTKTKVGYRLGIIGEYFFNESLGLQSALIWNSKGFALDFNTFEDLDPEIQTEGFSRTSFNYIEVPISAIYRTNNVEVYLGPYVGFGINGKSNEDYTLTVGMNEIVNNEDVDYVARYGELSEAEYNELISENKNVFQGFDVGFNIGIGYRLGSFLLSSQYSYGFGNIVPNVQGEEIEEGELSNRVISFSVSYFLGD